MKHLLPILLLFLALASCDQRQPPHDQGRAPLCWVYAMLECIEQERRTQGDTLTFSRQWLAAAALREQATWQFRTGAGDITLRGTGPEALRLIAHYGLVPYANEKTHLQDAATTIRRLQRYNDKQRQLHATEDDYRQGLDTLLPRFATAPDGAFYFFGMRYTPQQFAQSVMYNQDWQFYTATTLVPFGDDIVLPVADNTRHYYYRNVPRRTLLHIALAALRDGHPVYWEFGRTAHDPAHGGFTSSDHAMAIVGTTRTADHQPRLIARNSYGRRWGDQGYCLVSYKDFIETTSNIGIIQ